MQAYFADIFRILEQGNQKTAYEVAQVLQKDFAMSIPVVGRQKHELLGPTLRVSLELMTEFELGIDGWMYGGKPLPEYEYDLELISPLGLAVKYTELQKMSDLVTLNSRLAMIDPAVWLEYSLSEMSRAIGESMGVPRKWLRPRSERNAIAARIDELMEQQIAMQKANLASDTMQKLTKGAEANSPAMAMAGA